MPIDVGAIVCVHNDGKNIDTWVGIVTYVRLDDEILHVKQMGFRQVTTFPFQQYELRETVVTFEGPMCVTCRRPP